MVVFDIPKLLDLIQWIWVFKKQEYKQACSLLTEEDEWKYSDHHPEIPGQPNLGGNDIYKI